MFKVPIYRRPPDLVPPLNSAGVGFPNKGTSLRRTSNGELVAYYDRGEILDGALDGQHLEICWIKNQADALMIQIEGAARVRLEDGTLLRINYDAHNGYQFVPVSRILIERNIIPRQEMSLERIREWMRANPENAEELRRQNRSFVFFRIVGLSDEREAVGAQGIPLTPGRSIAVDGLLHVYGTPFFLQAGLPLTAGSKSIRFDRLMIAQDTGSAIVVRRVRMSSGEPAKRRDVSLGASIIVLPSLCWCPGKSTLSQLGRACLFPRKSPHSPSKPMQHLIASELGSGTPAQPSR